MAVTASDSDTGTAAGGARELAIERGHEAPLAAGWSALAEYLATPTLRAPHLDQFRWHPQLAPARAG